MKRKLTIIAIAIVLASFVCLTALFTTANATTSKAISVTGYCGEGYTHDPFISYRNDATYWFTKWGCDVWSAWLPSKNEYEAHIRDSNCKYVYSCGHGSPNGFTLGPGGVGVHAEDVTIWLEDREKMTFTFLFGCDCMGDTGPGTISHAFRKGSMIDTVVIGYEDLHLHGCQYATYCFQHALFEKIDTGVALKDAFDYALTCCPQCVGCAVFDGDETMTLANSEGVDDVTIVDLPWWFVDTNGDHIADKFFMYGQVGGTPLIGDINCDGNDDTIYVKDEADGTLGWYCDTNNDHIIDEIFWYGQIDDIPLVGDVNQDGTDDTIYVKTDGAYQTYHWYVDIDCDHVADDDFWYGAAGMKPLVGDVDQDGLEDIVVVRDIGGSGYWIVDNDYNHAYNFILWYGRFTDIPLIGDVYRIGRSDMVAFRDGAWYVDKNHDEEADDLFWYGKAGDIPLIGNLG